MYKGGKKMNDFTKADLLDILFVIKSLYGHKNKENKTMNDPLYKKIQSLIDNYPTHCEHSGVKLDV